MSGFEDERLDDMEARMHREDPRFAGALAAGRVCSPREYRHAPAWTLLSIALVVLAVGTVFGQGLLIAAGLVLGGIAGHLFDPQRKRPRRPGAPPLR